MEIEGDICPICLVPCVPNQDDSETPTFCRSACSHILCQPCAERLLLAGSSSLRIPHPGLDADIHYGTPTLGLCPTCRQKINLLDFKKLGSDELVYSKNHINSSWPIYQSSYESSNKEGGTAFACMTFKFFDTSSIEIQQGNGTSMKVFELDASSHFFEKSMTFHGSLPLQSPIGPKQYNGMDCVLQFSSDCRYIRDGYIRWKLTPTNPSEFPLDGSWRVTWLSGESAEINIHRHRWSLFSKDYQIEIGGEEEQYRPKFFWPFSEFWPFSGVQQTSTISVPPGSTGPGIGDSFEWTTTHKNYAKITWTRLGFLDANCHYDVQFLNSGRGSMLFRRRLMPNLSEGPRRPSYNSTSLWGNTFCQDFCVGLASYHFLPISERGESTSYEAYISYEHAATNIWPNLDDGSPIPARAHFRQIEWDEANLTFKGEICWLQEFGSTWQGERSWRYEIKFDSSFAFIVSGRVLCLDEYSDVPRESRHFGIDLVYINACTSTYLNEALDEFTPDVAQRNLESRWYAEGATEPTADMLVAVLNGQEITLL